MAPRPGFTKGFKKPYNRAKGWRADAYFAPVNISAPYTYLNDLLDYAGENTWRTAAHAIGEAAKNLLDEGNFKELGVGGGSRNGHLRTYSVDDAINFLTTVANSMRSHEISYIKKRINDLQAFPGAVSDDLINKFNSMSEDNFDYVAFISLLNEVHNKIQLYKRRLAAFKREGQTRNLERDIAGELGTAVSNYTDRRTRYSNSQHSIINMLSMRFFETNTGREFIGQCVKLGAQGAKNFTAALALIQRELAQYLTDNGDLIYSQRIMEEQDFIDEVNKLTTRLTDFAEETNIFSALGNQKLLDDLINIYGIQIEDKALTAPKTKESKEARKKLKEMLKKLQIDQKLTTDKNFNKFLKRVKVKAGGGLLYIHDELESILINALNGGHTHTGNLNMATDLLYFSVDNSEDEEQDKKFIQQIQDETDNIVKYIQDSDAANNPKKTAQIYAEQLDKLDAICSNLEHSFIFHETNKLYTSIEGGKGFRKYGSNSIAAFSGRNMSIFNYIDSMAMFGAELGIDTTWLNFAAYNLAGNALGSGLITHLENALAVAAGLIMFDDFAQIAQEATGQLAYSSIENIHLYKLNGFYVPSSYFIMATVQSLRGMQTMDAMNGFKTKIKAPGAVNYNRDHEKPNPTPQDWEIVKSAASDVDIHLYFGANFLALIDKLQS